MIVPPAAQSHKFVIPQKGMAEAWVCTSRGKKKIIQRQIDLFCCFLQNSRMAGLSDAQRGLAAPSRTTVGGGQNGEKPEITFPGKQTFKTVYRSKELAVAVTGWGHRSTEVV